MERNYGEVHEEMEVDLSPKLADNVTRLCKLLGKSTKQSSNTILLVLLGMFSVAVGHGQVEVTPTWTEATQLWIVISMITGRCKSTLHKYVKNVMDRVIRNLDEGKLFHPDRKSKDIIMPHCTWEKFGEIMTCNGGRIFGLHDELMHYFQSCALYTKAKGMDTNQAEFLSLFNGGSKRRETITGNSNYDMNATHLTLLGFTQPNGSLKILDDPSCTVSGFGSRFLWYFPKPIYCYFGDLELERSQKAEFKELTEILVEALTDLYSIGEKNYRFNKRGSVLSCNTGFSTFFLSRDAGLAFESAHDEFEDVTKINYNNTFLAGLYSKAKSHILRMAAIIEVMNSEMAKHSIGNTQHATEVNDVATDQPMEHVASDTAGTAEEATGTEQEEGAAREQEASIEPEDENDTSSNSVETQTGNDDEINVTQGPQNNIEKTSMELAIQLVRISIRQQILVHSEEPKTKYIATAQALFQGVELVLKMPGKIISATILTRGNKFRNIKGNTTAAKFALEVFRKMKEDGYGDIIERTAKNNTTVYYFEKKEPSEEMVDSLHEAGVSLDAYSGSYNLENEDSERHKTCFRMSKKRSNEN